MPRKPLLAALAFLATTLPAQEAGQWRAVSTTARGITGDVSITDTRIYINFNGFTLAQIRTLTPAESSALFHADANTQIPGNLFRTEIPGSKRFLHKNTLCGSEDVQWIATYISGKTLQVAMFSGAPMPTLTADALANATNLCGTYSYAR